LLEITLSGKRGVGESGREKADWQTDLFCWLFSAIFIIITIIISVLFSYTFFQFVYVLKPGLRLLESYHSPCWL